MESRFPLARAAAITALLVVGLGVWCGEAKSQVSCDMAWSLRADSGPPPPPVGMFYDPMRQLAVMIISADASGGNATTWEWDGSNWMLHNTQTSPEVSSGWGASMAFDIVRGRAVLLSHSSTPGKTWEYDGSDWTLVSVNGPANITSSTMVYDSARARCVILAADIGTGNPHFETWEWDGTGWTRRNPQQSPALPNPGAWTMAFDSIRSRAVVVTSTGATWEWDGAEWTPRGWRPLAGPVCSAAMAFDQARGRCVLVERASSAYYSQCDRNDLWEWDGTSWSPRPWMSVNGNLVSRSNPTLVFDSARSRIVMFGGVSATTPPYGLRDTWELEPSGPPTITSQSGPQALYTGQKATLFVTAASNGTGGPLAFQWRKNGSAMVCGGRISGCGSPVLTIEPVDAADAGTYDVVVSTACGSATSSPMPLALGCRTDYDRNGIIQPADIGSFVSAWFASLSGSCPP